MRTCKKCGQQKPVKTFPPYRVRGKEGRRHTCRECWNAKWTPIVSSHVRRYYHENTNGYRDRAKVRTARHHRANPEAHHRRNREFEKRHPERVAAKRAVAAAIRSGRLVRQSCCVCGSGPAQAHHDDYSKPLEILWLCRFHHGERHRLLNRGADPAEWPADLRVREMPEIP